MFHNQFLVVYFESIAMVFFPMVFVVTIVVKIYFLHILQLDDIFLKHSMRRWYRATYGRNNICFRCIGRDCHDFENINEIFHVEHGYTGHTF